MKTQTLDERMAAFISEVESSDLYEVVSAKSDIAVLIYERMETLDVSRAELARRLGKSRPYISKLLSGETNLTVETLVQIARALDCHFSAFIPRAEAHSAGIRSVADFPAQYFAMPAARPNLRMIEGGQQQKLLWKTLAANNNQSQTAQVGSCLKMEVA